MARVKHTDGPARFNHRSFSGISTYGDVHDVSESAAEYLCEEVGFFERLGDVTDVEYAEVEPDDEIDAETVEELGDAVIEQRIDAGECPWCSDYEGENVGMHASRAHPDAWDDYTED